MVPYLHAAPLAYPTRCSWFTCPRAADLLLAGEASCAEHFVKRFSRAAFDARIERLVETVKANGFDELPVLGAA